MNNEVLTAMFLAKGAGNDHNAYCKACDAFDGELAFLDHLATFAPKVEGVYQEIKKSREFDVWMYDVVEKFGEFLTGEVRIPEGESLSELIRLTGAASGGKLSPEEQLVVLRGWNGDKHKYPFPETYFAALLSTAHIDPDTMDVLNQMGDHLPTWITPTEFGYIMRFDLLENLIKDGEGATIDEYEWEEHTQYLSSCADLTTLREFFIENGVYTAHFDDLGPRIGRLPCFE